MGSRIGMNIGKKLGEETHKRLQVKPRFAAPVNYGEY